MDKRCGIAFNTTAGITFLLGNVEELLQKLDPMILTYQHVDSLYAHFKYRLSGKIVVKSGQVFDNVQ